MVFKYQRTYEADNYSYLKTWVQSLGWEDALEKRMATHSSILPRRISQTEKPGGLQSTGLQRVRHDLVTNTFLFLSIKDKPRSFQCSLKGAELITRRDFLMVKYLFDLDRLGAEQSGQESSCWDQNGKDSPSPDINRRLGTSGTSRCSPPCLTAVPLLSCLSIFHYHCQPDFDY